MRVMANKAVAGVSGLTPLAGVVEERIEVDDEYRGDAAIKPSEDVLPEQTTHLQFLPSNSLSP